MTSHTFPVTVYYEDTDAGGIVYYANYLKFTERARSELLRELGFNHGLLRNESETLLVVKTAAIDYKKPAKLDDHLTVCTTLDNIRKVSVDMIQTIMRNDETLVTMTIKIASIGENGKPKAMPEQLRHKFVQF